MAQTKATISKHPVHPMAVVFPIGLAAAVPGFIDYTDMQGRAKELATYHMIMNLAAVALYALNCALRTKWGARYSAWASRIRRSGASRAAASRRRPPSDTLRARRVKPWRARE